MKKNNLKRFLATLAAAFATWGTGKLLRNHVARIALGGFFPVAFNALVIPVIIVFLCGDLSYGTQAATPRHLARRSPRRKR